MRRWSAGRSIGAAAAACLLLASSATAAPAVPSRAEPVSGITATPDRYIVVVHDGSDVRTVIADHGSDVRAGRRYRHVFSGFAATMTAATAAVVAADSRVATVEADGYLHRVGAQGWPTWGLDRIDQPRRTLNSTYAYAESGRGVAAYVVDGGVYAGHRGFGDRVTRGFDLTGEGARRDCDGHGTHIAGTIGSRRWGVAKRVRIVPVRVADCADYIRRSDVVAGLDYVVRHHRAGDPAVVNISLAGPASRVADRAVNRVIDDGVTVVTAAGNQGTDACMSSPGRVDRVITVGAINRYDWSPNWSNVGPCVDIFAPGVGIRSAGTSSPTASRKASGTSMAAPHVAGVAARYLSAHPTAPPSAVRRHILSTATFKARNTGAGTTRRTLYAPGKVPTRLGIRLSRDWVDPDDYLTVRTRLRNAITGAGLSQTVLLQARRPSAPTWQRVDRVRTDRDGHAASIQRPGRRMVYRWQHPGSALSKRSTGPASRVGFRRWRTHLEFLQTAEMVGAFTTLEGYPLRDYVIQLQSRPDPEQPWVHVQDAYSDDEGRVRFAGAPVPGLQYRMEHTGTWRTRPAVSGVYPP